MISSCGRYARSYLGLYLGIATNRDSVAEVTFIVILRETITKFHDASFIMNSFLFIAAFRV